MQYKIIVEKQSRIVRILLLILLMASSPIDAYFYKESDILKIITQFTQRVNHVRISCVQNNRTVLNNVVRKHISLY